MGREVSGTGRNKYEEEEGGDEEVKEEEEYLEITSNNDDDDMTTMWRARGKKTIWTGKMKRNRKESGKALMKIIMTK